MKTERTRGGSDHTVAVLYQASKPPVREGAAKPLKPGGYSDSGADIGFALQTAGISVATPVRSPDPARPLDWVFPDTQPGIQEALRAGATTLWANTTLFAGHPLERFMDQATRIVGQVPEEMERFDDKFSTGCRLRAAALPVAKSVLVAGIEQTDAVSIYELSEARLATLGLALPLILKPVRGRGSQGVVLVRTTAELTRTAETLMAAQESEDGISYPLYGSRLILEQYLQGEEITLTVMPAGEYALPYGLQSFSCPWSLPAVRRTGHDHGVVPYNGLVPVTQNSVALTAAEQQHPAIAAAMQACARAADLVSLRAPIRIDCRRVSAEPNSPFVLFDLNMKPNLTGTGRPGREAQDCLSAIAARALGWSYPDLLLNMLAQAW